VADDATAETWEGDRAARWIKQSAGLERQLAPVGDLVLEAAALGTGEAVLDVGCGTGPAARRAAAAVGPSGRVTGLDIAENMLDAAASRPVEPGWAPLDWTQADPVTWSPPAPPPYDVVISQFGVMFFSDPVAAFGNLARATRLGGRLAIAVWARRDESEQFAVPLRVARRVLERLGLTPDVPADDEGPFSMYDDGSIERIVDDAGWSDVEVTSHDLRLQFGCGLTPAEAATAALDFGPTRVVTTGIGEKATAAVVDALADTFASYVDDSGHVVLGGRVNIARASRA
jgi:SAM-dependent methyltransferase